MADFTTVFNSEIFGEEYSKNNQIDFFFTKRTTSYTKEVIQKDLTRIDQKFSRSNNFIVLDLNFDNIKEDDIITVEIWGDKGYYYQGKISDSKGVFPLIALKLKEDSQIFLKFIILNKEEKPINYINFITIPKKYQFDEDEISSENNI
tara:strand:- start:880 stop:1323 length:444 start_codon:yes stop_codon:yes gene_type:complete